MKIKPLKQMLLPLKFKKKAVQMTFRFNKSGYPPKPIVQPEPKPKKLDKFM